MPSARSLLLIAAAAPTVMAADIASLTSAIDIFYYMFCGCGVFLMQYVQARSLMKRAIEPARAVAFAGR